MNTNVSHALDTRPLLGEIARRWERIDGGDQCNADGQSHAITFPALTDRPVRADRARGFHAAARSDGDHRPNGRRPVTVPMPPPTPTAERGSTGRTAPLPLDPGGTAELVGKILRGIPPLPGALCRSEAELFGSDDADDQAAAAAICRACPALPQCSEWVASLPKSQRPLGVVAGQPTNKLEGSLT